MAHFYTFLVLNIGWSLRGMIHDDSRWLYFSCPASAASLPMKHGNFSWQTVSHYWSLSEMSEMSMRFSTKWFTFETWWWCYAMVRQMILPDDTQMLRHGTLHQLKPSCLDFGSHQWLVWPLEPWAHPSFLPGRTGIAPVFRAAQPERENPHQHQQPPILPTNGDQKLWTSTHLRIRVYHSISSNTWWCITWNPQSYPIKSAFHVISWVNLTTLTYLTMAPIVYGSSHWVPMTVWVVPWLFPWPLWEMRLPHPENHGNMEVLMGKP